MGDGCLSDIADIEMGQSPPGATCSTLASGTPLLNGPTEFGPHHPTPAQWTTDPRKMARAGDVLFCVRGSTTGRMNWADQDYAIGRGVAAIRHKQGPEYQHFVRGVIESTLPFLLAAATGSTFPNVSRSQLRELPCEIPPLPEQKALAHILGTLDDKIELNRRINETLEGIARTIFKSWFVDFDPVRAKAEGRDTGLPKEVEDLFPDGFEDSELGAIPTGWKAVTASELFEVNPRVPLSKGTIAPYVDMKALPIAGFSVTDVIKKEFKGGSKFQQGDVLLARITPCLENGKTGLVDFLPEGEVGFGSTEFIVLRGRDGISTEFVYCIARDERFRQHCIASMVGSSGRQRVQTACFDQFMFAEPPDALLTEFARRARASFGKISDNSRELAVLAGIRDRLLSGLLSGAIPVLPHKGATG